MDRRAFIGDLAGGLLAAPLAAEAQPAGKVYRVGYLSAGSPSEYLNQGLKELGWIDGQNLIVERRWAEGKNERLPALAAELVQRKVDLIVAPTEPAALAAKNATSSVPILRPVRRAAPDSPGSQGRGPGLAYAEAPRREDPHLEGCPRRRA